MIDCLVEDVSRSGLFLRSPEWMRPGSCAELELEVAQRAQRAPELGQHTAEVLTELGLSADELSALAADEVIGQTR